MYKNKRRYNSRNQENNFSQDFLDDNQHHKKYSKSMILLKSTVFSMLIIFVTLLTVFIIVKNKKSQNNNEQNQEIVCDKFKNIKISAEIDEIKNSDSQIIILTKKDKSSHQELIKIDGKCLNKLGKIQFEIF